MAEQNLLTEENAMEVTESTEQESVQALSVEAAEPVATGSTEQETENAYRFFHGFHRHRFQYLRQRFFQDLHAHKCWLCNLLCIHFRLEEPDELAQAVEKVLSDQTIVPQVVKFIRQYKTKQGINNALNKEFKDSKRTSEIYSAIKPLKHLFHCLGQFIRLFC